MKTHWAACAASFRVKCIISVAAKYLVREAYHSNSVSRSSTVRADSPILATVESVFLVADKLKSREEPAKRTNGGYKALIISFEPFDLPADCSEDSCMRRSTPDQSGAMCNLTGGWRARILSRKTKLLCEIVEWQTPGTLKMLASFANPNTERRKGERTRPAGTRRYGADRQSGRRADDEGEHGHSIT